MPIRIERHDSALGRWLLARWEPLRLADLVEGIWYFEGSLTYLRERHFPTGRAEIVVRLGEVYRHVEGSRTEPFPLTCASGLLIRPDVIEAPPGESTVLGIRLRPLGANEVFRAQVGVNPKRLARIHRFRRALSLVIDGDAPLSEVALEADYYDQSHFNGEFREMSGFTPSAYRSAQRFPESPSLAEHAG